MDDKLLVYGVGIALLLIGALVLLVFPDRPGGVIKSTFLGRYTIEVASKSAGLPLVALALLAVIYGTTLDPDPVPGSDMLAEMQLVGTARPHHGDVRLTSGKAAEAGAAWTPRQFDVARSFTAELDVRVLSTNDDASDGIAFVIQDHNARALGLIGGGMGYESIPRSIAVELDTWQNPPDEPGEPADPNDNHIAVQTRGLEPNEPDPIHAKAVKRDIPQLANGKVHTVSVRYARGRLRVCIAKRDCLSHPVDIASTIGSTAAWLGVTAATGGADVAGIFEVLRFDVDAG